MAETGLFQNLDSLPRLNQSHQWADYIELLAISSEDQRFSKGELQAAAAEIEDVAVDQEDIDYDQDQENPAITLADEDIQKQEKINRRWAEVRASLNSRQQRLGDAWPFNFTDDVLTVNINQDAALHRLYIALLLASALRYIVKARHGDITASLEEIAYQLFCRLMPDSTQNAQSAWIVKPFGAHQNLANGYQGKLFNKLQQLAKDLNGKLIAQESDFDPRDTGDAGLDVVAWHPLGDALGNMPVAFAQCGCSLTDLRHKQYEASPVNWANKLSIQHPQANYYFAPHDLRKNNGGWDEQLGQVIMLDRSRILHLAKMYQLPAHRLNWSHVHEAIQTRRAYLS